MCCVLLLLGRGNVGYFGIFSGEMEKSPILSLGIGSPTIDECHLVLWRITPSNLQKGSPQHIAKQREETKSFHF